jgi:WD40 repeat protein
MTDVFISYSRRDKAFVQNLFELLEAHGHDTWVDWDDIEYAEDWWRKICAGIEAASNFVFVMTPESVRSKVCFDEVEFAVSCNKRIIPVLRHDIVEDADQQRMHPALRRHNWLPLKDEAVTQDSLQVLLETIAHDPEHVQAHTRLLIRSREWERLEHNRSLLLRGDDLRQAEAWLTEAVDREPAPTHSHAEFIAASRIAERGRQRSLFAGVTVALMAAVGLALLSFGLFRQSEERRVESELRGTAVAEQAATATLALGAAEINLRQAWDVQSRLLADFSRQELESGSAQTALLLALESLTHAGDGVVNLENTSALRNALTSPAEALFMQHDDIVWGAGWNADSSRILTYSSDGTARLWDTTRPDSAMVLQHGAPVISAAWNADRSQVMTASADGTARVWDAVTGDNRLTLTHSGAVWGGTWFRDGTRILTVENREITPPERADPGMYTGWIHVWDAADGHNLLALEHPDLVRFAWVTRDGTRIFTSCDDGLVRQWDTSSGELIDSLQHDDPVFRAVLNEDETLILSLSMQIGAGGDVPARSAVTVWDVASGDAVLVLDFDAAAGDFPKWNRGGSRFLTAFAAPESGAGLIQVWDVATGEAVLTLRHLSADGDTFAVEPQAIWNDDETRILSWAGNTVLVWDAVTGELRRTLQHDARVRGVVWSADGLRVLAWDEAGVIQVWNLATQTALNTLRHDDTVAGAAWNEDESTLLSWSYDGTARLWYAADPTRLLQLEYETPFGGAAWSPDGRQVASWSGPTAAVWDTETGQQVFSTAHDGQTVHGMVWNADGSAILSWGRDTFARLWDARDGREILSLPHADVVLHAQWSHSESHLLTLTLDGSLHVWDQAAGSETFAAVRYTPESSGGAAWSPDDQAILTWSSSEPLLRLWDAGDGTEIQTIPTEPGFPGAAWDPTGMRILHWNNGDTAHIRHIDSTAGTLTLRHVNRRADLEGFDSDIVGGVWSADGHRVLTWTVYGDVRLWDADSGVELLAVDDCGIRVQWSADESRLLCASSHSANDGVRIWDIARGEVVLEYPLTISSQMDGVAWSPDERRILAWTILDAAAYVWIGDIQELIAIGQSRAYRELSAEERARFFIPASN